MNEGITTGHVGWSPDYKSRGPTLRQKELLDTANIMTNELQTDDEALREQGMTDGPKKIGKWRLEPMNVDTLGWMQSLGIFDDENDISFIHKSAAFVVLHASPEDEIMGVVFNKREFWSYVSKWIRKNVKHHDELLPYANELNSAWDRYNACVSASANPSEESAGPKN